MIIFRLMGGLGNQMFTYAAARAFSARRGTEVWFDFDCPYEYVHYEYALGIFTLTAPFAPAAALRRLKPKRGLERRVRMLLGQDPSARLVMESTEFRFNEDFFAIPDESYVHGYWQTEQYFLPIAADIRAQFRFRAAPEGANAAMLERIERSPSVSIHIRRGDYVAVEKTSAIHGLCSLEYYRQAMAVIEAAIPDPVYYVFSNDLPWVKANLAIRKEHHFVENNTGAASSEDLRLMSRCRHHVIANSSFSWWGAWLNPNPGKIVVAPKQWMTTMDGTGDLIPRGWTQI